MHRAAGCEWLRPRALGHSNVLGSQVPPGQQPLVRFAQVAPGELASKLSAALGLPPLAPSTPEPVPKPAPKPATGGAGGSSLDPADDEPVPSACATTTTASGPDTAVIVSPSADGVPDGDSGEPKRPRVSPAVAAQMGLFGSPP